MRFQHSLIKTVGGVSKSAKKCTKMTSLYPHHLNRLSDDLETYARMIHFKDAYT